jgi:hypothetical protein
MKNLHSLWTGIWAAAMLGLMMAGCAPAQGAAPQLTDAIQQIRSALDLPQSPLVFVENTAMVNSPGGDLLVANFQDGEGRVYSVDLAANKVVEIDARAVLAKISPAAPLLAPDQIKARVMTYVKAVVPDFDPVRSALQYEEGGKVENYFFAWRAEAEPGAMNGPWLQIGMHQSGVLFAYINTLGVGR